MLVLLHASGNKIQTNQSATYQDVDDSSESFVLDADEEESDSDIKMTSAPDDAGAPRHKGKKIKCTSEVTVRPRETCAETKRAREETQSDADTRGVKRMKPGPPSQKALSEVAEHLGAIEEIAQGEGKSVMTFLEVLGIKGRAPRSVSFYNKFAKFYAHTVKRHVPGGQGSTCVILSHRLLTNYCRSRIQVLCRNQ